MAAAPVLITRRVPEAALEALRRAKVAFDVLAEERDAPRDQVLAALPGRHAVLTMLSDRVDAEFLDAAGEDLKVVANFAVGFNNIDLEEIRRRGVAATHTPGVLTEATADLAWALILAVARRVVEGDRLVRAGRFEGWGPMMLLGEDLVSRTLGIVGAGRIGQAVARRSAGWQMRVLFTARSPKPEFERDTPAERVELERLLEESDIVSVNVPHTPQTHHLVGRDQFRRMKPSALFINTARGAVHDEEALVWALERGEIAGAGLDVYENEPEVHPGLMGLDRAVLLPHIGSGTVQTRQKMARMAVENILAALRGDPPPNLIPGAR